MKLCEYSRGKNPNSLKNLQRGKKFDKARAVKAGQKSAEAKKRYKTIKEVMSDILQEWQNNSLSITKIEAILRKYISEVLINPTYKDILAIQKILGEDVQKVEVEQSSKYDEIEVTQKDIEHALTLLCMKHEQTKKYNMEQKP